MKKNLLLTLLFVGLVSCSNEPLEDGSVSSDLIVNSKVSLGKGNPNSGSLYSDYNVNVGVSADGETWTYTITRAKTNAKNLSHFIIDLANCGDVSATFANIVSATVNGDAANLVPTEGSGTDCNPQATTFNFVKVNLDAADSWLIVLKFDVGYELFTDADSWIKAGNACNTGKTTAPGCRRSAYCSYSQGFFFSNGSLNNGSHAYWGSGLTVGVDNYSHAEGMEIWSIDRGQGGDQTLNAFFQLGAARLSGIESQVSAHVAIIDTYFTEIGNVYDYPAYTNQGNQYFNLPNGIAYTKKQVTAAGSAIGAYIDANHCD